MGGRNSLRRVVTIAFLALTVAAAVCPAECLVTSGHVSAEPCHREEGSPPAHPLPVAACCAAFVVPPSSGLTDGAWRMQPAVGVPGPSAALVQSATLSHRRPSAPREHAPPDLRFRTSVLVI